MIQRTKLLLVKQLNISPGLLTPDILPVPLDYRCIQNSQAPGTQSHQLPPISGSLSFCDPTTCFKNDYSKQNTHQSHLSFWAAHEPIPIFSLGHTKHWEGSSHKPLQPVLWFIRRKKIYTWEAFKYSHRIHSDPWPAPCQHPHCMHKKWPFHVGPVSFCNPLLCWSIYNASSDTGWDPGLENRLARSAPEQAHGYIQCICHANGCKLNCWQGPFLQSKKKKTSKSFFLRYKKDNCKLKEETGGRESWCGLINSNCEKRLLLFCTSNLKRRQVRVGDLSPRKVNQQL